MGFFSKLWKKIVSWVKPPVKGQGFNVEKQGTNNPIPVIYGYQAKAPCSKVLKATTNKKGGAKNEYLHLVCVICEGEVEELGTVYFNGIAETQIDNERYYIERFTGSDTQNASATLTNELSKWTSNARLSGIAYLYVRLKMNKKGNWWQGEPAITVDVKGRKVVDIRTSQVGYTENPALCLYDYLTNERFGKGLKPSKLDLQSFINEANFIETQRTYTRTVYKTEYDPESGNWLRTPSGTVNETVSENLFGCNVRLDTDKEIKENVETIKSGMRAILPESNGKYKLIIEKDTAPVFTFTNDHIVGGIDTDGGSQNDRYNQVTIKFRNKLTGEEDEATFPEDDATYQTLKAQDNDTHLPAEFTFDTIDNRAEALQMARVILYRSRDQVSARFVGTPETMVVEVGDIVLLPSKIFGWNNKPMRVEHIEYDIEKGSVSFQGIEHQNSIYPWAISDVTEEYVDTSFALIQNLLSPTGLAYSKALDTADHMGVLSWADPDDVMVTGYEVEVKDTDLDQLVWSTETNQFNVKIPRLSKGSYTATVSAKNALFISDSVGIVLTAVAPKVPNGLNANAGNFEIILSPTIDGVAGHLLFDLKVSENTTESQAVSLGRGRVFVDNDLPPETTRNYWVRSVNGAGESEWSQMFSATTTNDDTNLLQVLSNLGKSNFNQDVTNLLDQVEQVTSGATLPDIISGLKLDINGLENSEANLVNQYQTLATDALAQANAANQRDIGLADFRNEIAAWKVEVDNDLQTLVITGGTILPSEWTSYKLTVDAQAATLNSLSSKQTEQDGVLNTHTSQIQQSSDRLTFLEENSQIGDFAFAFNAIQLQLDGQNNRITQQASSLRSADVETVNQILKGGLTEAEQAEFDFDLSVAKKSLESLTDETQSLAQSNEQLLSKHDNSLALLEQTSKSLATAVTAQASDKRTLTARINDEESKRIAEVQRIDQVNIDQDSATAASIAIVTAQVESEESTRLAEIQRIDAANADQDSATAVSIASVTAQINNEESQRIAAVQRLDQANIDQDSATAVSIASVTAQINSEESTRKAEITRVDSVLVNKAEQSALTALTARVSNDEEALASANIILSAHSDDINNLQSQVVIGTDVNGQFAGIYINNTLVNSSIAFQSNEVEFVNPHTGLKDIVYNALNQRLEVGCELMGASGTFSGSLIAAGGTFNGDLSAVGGTFNGMLIAAGGTFSGDLNAAGGTFSGNLSAASGDFEGDVTGSSFNGLRIKMGSFPSTTDGDQTINVNTYEGRIYNPSTGSYTSRRTSAPFSQLVGVTLSHMGNQATTRDMNFPIIKTNSTFIFNRDDGYTGTQYFSYLAYGV